MPTSDALQRFVNDELMRATSLAEQLVDEASGALRRAITQLNPRERSQAVDVQRALTAHRGMVVREFVRSLTDHVQRELTQEESTGSPPPSVLGGLSLVDENQVEVDVEVSRAIEAIRSVAEHELRELMTYTSALVGDMDVARDYNPLRPEVLGRTLWEAAQALPVSRAVQLTFTHHAALPMAQLMRRAYAGACSRLEAQGVEPAVYRTIIIAGSQRSKQQDAFFDPGANRAESGGSAPDTAHSATTAAPLDQVLAHSDQALRALPVEGGRAQRDQLRNLQRQQQMASAETDADRELVELIGRLFDAVLGDRRLQPDVQNLLSRLQAPALRLALREPAVLDNYTHPVWLLMDRLALQGDTHPPAGDPARSAMLRAMHGLLDALTQEQASDADAFRWARERVMGLERERFEHRREATEAELNSLQTLEDQAMAGGPAPTEAGALDVGQLDTVPAALLDDLLAAEQRHSTAAEISQWLQNRRSGEWVRMFMQGNWVHAQLLWYGTHREYWLFADGASASTWAIRRRALERMLQQQLMDLLTPRSLIRDAASRVLDRLGQG